MLHEQMVDMHWTLDCRACTPAHLKLPALNYWSAAKGGRPELWRGRTLGSTKSRRLLQRGDIEDLLGTRSRIRPICCSKIHFFSEPETLCFQCCNSWASEKLDTVQSDDGTPLLYHYVICDKDRAKNKDPNRMKSFCRLFGIKWPLSNQANRLSHCSSIFHCKATQWTVTSKLNFLPRNNNSLPLLLQKKKKQQQEKSPTGLIKEKHGKCSFSDSALMMHQ